MTTLRLFGINAVQMKVTTAGSRAHLKRAACGILEVTMSRTRTMQTTGTSERVTTILEPMLVRESEAARLLGLHPVTLRVWRRKGRGPGWIRLNGKIIAYPLMALREWISAQSSDVR